MDNCNKGCQSHDNCDICEVKVENWEEKFDEKIEKSIEQGGFIEFVKRCWCSKYSLSEIKSFIRAKILTAKKQAYEECLRVAKENSLPDSWGVQYVYIEHLESAIKKLLENVK